MQHRERDILLRLGNAAQDALRQQRTHMVSRNINSFKKEKPKCISFGIKWNRSNEHR